MFDIILPILFFSDYTKKTLETLERTHLQYRLVIIYNGDNDKDGDSLSEIAEIYHSFGENVGIAKSWNWGAQQSEENDLIFINDDILLPQWWLEAFNSGLEDDWMICPQYTRWDDTVWIGKRDLVDNTLVKAIVGPPPYFAGFCWGLKREAYKQIGAFDEDFFYWFTDTDYYFRCGKMGMPPKQLQGFWIHHYESKTLNQIMDDAREQIEKEKDIFHKKHGVRIL